jgi:hypothetical protein
MTPVWAFMISGARCHDAKIGMYVVRGRPSD